MKHRKRSKRSTVSLFISTWLLLLVCLGFIFYKHSINADVVPVSDSFGIHAALPALPSEAEKQVAVAKTVEAGFGWVRHEFYYEPNINYANYDTAQRITRANGLKTLGLLTYPGSERSHEDWKNFVRAITSHYKNDVAAWEIMNEIDNYLSPAEYVTYLQEARDIIDQTSPGSIIVLSGITSRPEAVKFWDGVAEAGGWDDFDVVGLHHYHRQNPERVNFGGGDLISELSRPIASIRKYGEKKIWLTEVGYLDAVGRDNQANWLARTFIIAKSIPEIEKFFIYRLTNKGTDFPFGILDESFNEYPVFQVVKDTISKLNVNATAVRIQAADRTEVDGFNQLSGWAIPDRKNAEAQLNLASGPDGSGMKIDYQFSNNPAYVAISKRIPLGKPQAIAAWFNGDDAHNVWKFRFLDARNETFQLDIGTIPSGWTFKQFTLGHDTAIVSWNGDGNIDYPITFDSIVIDRQGGKSAGSGIVDELTIMTNNADYYAYQYGGTLAYWKASGSGSIGMCGENIEFIEKVQYRTGLNCSDKEVVRGGQRKSPPVKTTVVRKPAATRPAPKSVAPSPVPTQTPQATEKIDVAQSTVEVDGRDVKANGISSYRLIVTLKDKSGRIHTDIRPEVLPAQFGPIQVVGPVATGESWTAAVAAEQAGSHDVNVMVLGAQLKKVNLTFDQPNIEAAYPAWYTVLMGLYRNQRFPGLFIFWLGCVAVTLGVAIWAFFKGIAYLIYRPASSEIADHNDHVHAYIAEQLARGNPPELIRQSLRANGWQDEKINTVFKDHHRR